MKRITVSGIRNLLPTSRLASLLASDPCWPVVFAAFQKRLTPLSEDDFATPPNGFSTRLFQRLMYQRMVQKQEWIAEFLKQHVSDQVVTSGPFAGLRYPTLKASCSTLAPKLLGTYEAEIAFFFLRSPGRSYRHIVDIGCAEGYYAVGTAIRYPDCKIDAYDLDKDARRRCESLAGENQVEDRVQVHGCCDHQALASLAGADALIISDCEGAEMDLFPPPLLRKLTKADFVIEVHTHLGADPSELAKRFESTHRTHWIPARTDLQRLNHYHHRLVDTLPVHEQIVLYCECRSPGNGWLIAEARSVRGAKG